MALAWHLKRVDPDEAKLAQLALKEVADGGATVPGLWYAEVANGLLVAERRGVTNPREIASFEADLRQLDLSPDLKEPGEMFASVISLARSSGLTAYDAAYLELALRTGLSLATFDRKLAEAVRKAGSRVFGDAA